MPEYKLTYFNITGLAEHIRMLFSYAGVDFVDNRISFEEWPSIKSKMPMEQMPVLEIDGEVFHQSRAIGRYLAKKFGLYGSNELESLKIDAAIDDIEDWRMLFARYFREENAEFKAKLIAVAEEKSPFFLRKLTERVKENGGFLVGGKLSYADIYLTSISDVMTLFAKKDVLEGYTELKQLCDKVRSTPKIKEWIEKRPKTDM